MGFRTGLHPLGGGIKAPYEKETVLFESSSPGIYSLEIKTGVYEIWICGAGGGYYRTSGLKPSKYHGGSAAAFKGRFKLIKNNYSIKVGAGGSTNTDGEDSSISNVILAGGGKRGSTTEVGILTTIEMPLVTELSANGVARESKSILGNGCGAGSTSYGGTGTNGYVKIVYKG